jgi:hypothetical protein
LVRLVLKLIVTVVAPDLPDDRSGVRCSYVLKDRSNIATAGALLNSGYLTAAALLD